MTEVTEHACHSLICMVSVEKSDIILIFVLPIGKVFFPSEFFQDFFFFIFDFLQFEYDIFPGGSYGKESACNAANLGSIPGLGRYS